MTSEVAVSVLESQDKKCFKEEGSTMSNATYGRGLSVDIVMEHSKVKVLDDL